MIDLPLAAIDVSVAHFPFFAMFSHLLRRSLVSTHPHSLRWLSTTRPRHDFHFDTHHFVQRLEREGLNSAQAEGIMSAMAEVIDESIRNMTANMVTKAEQEKVRGLTL